MRTPIASDLLYFALGIITLSFPVIIVSNGTYVAPAGRESEFPPTRVATGRSLLPSPIPMRTPIASDLLYFALGIITLSFPVIIVSNRTYVAPAGRESEFPPTRVATGRSLLPSPIPMRTPIASDLLYFALGIITLSFPVISVSNGTYVAPAGRESEFPPTRVAIGRSLLPSPIPMRTPIASDLLYFALGIITLSFPVISVSNGTYVAPAGRESEFPPTRVAIGRSLLPSPIPMRTPIASDLLYFALGIITLSFPVISVSNRTYVPPAGRESEFPPTRVATGRSLLPSPIPMRTPIASDLLYDLSVRLIPTAHFPTQMT